MSLNDINDIIGRIYRGSIEEVLSSSAVEFINRLANPDGPMHGPTRYDYAQIRVKAFKIAFFELMAEWPEITFVGDEDGSVGVQAFYTGWEDLDAR